MSVGRRGGGWIGAVLLIAAAGCGGAGAPGAPAPASEACCSRAALDQGLAIAARYRVNAIAERRFTHSQFWQAVAPYMGEGGLRRVPVGQSIQGRELRTVRFGSGPVKVLLWSQMHGDEATATMALADIFHFLARGGDDPLRQRLERELTIVFLPMLNPDGAELFQRENAAGIDVNRDARQLATPEAQALKQLRDSLSPDFGFNLHDQSARTRAGGQGLQAGIALLAPAYDSARSWNAVRTRARHLAATIAAQLQHEIPGRVARYDDDFTPRAFGDLMQQWGTSTVLIESGALPDDPQKQRLRALNVAAILGALDALARGTYREASTHHYDDLPVNTGGASDLLVLHGSLVLPGEAPIRADLAINYDDPVARTGARVRDVGDLRESVAIDTVDALGLFMHPDPQALTTRGNRQWLRLGNPARITLRRGAGAGSDVVRRIE